MTLLRIIRQCALWYEPDYRAAVMVCLKAGYPPELADRIREIIRHEKRKYI